MWTTTTTTTSTTTTTTTMMEHGYTISSPCEPSTGSGELITFGERRLIMYCFCVIECIVFRHCYPLVNEIASYFPCTTNVDPMFLKLVSHWHANSSRLLREFSRGTFARHSCECRENFHVSRTSRELVAKVLNIFKNWMRIFFPKYFARLSRDCRATVVRGSCDVRANVANLSPRNFGEFTMRNFRDTRTNVVRVSHDSRATVLRQHAKNSRLSGEKIKLSDIRTNVVRHSHDCRTN